MDDVKIGVPWRDQWGIGADKYRLDCGDACMWMALAYQLHIGGLTVDDLATLLPPIQGLSCGNLRTVLHYFNVDARVQSGLTIQQIINHIDAGRIVIGLFAYRDISNRQDQADKAPGFDGHFAALIGHTTAGDIYANDPDRIYGASYGPGIVYKATDLDKALADISDPIGGPRCGVVIYGEFPVTVDHVAQSNSSGVHFRSDPSLNGLIFGSLNTGDQVKVLAEAPIPAGSKTDGTYHVWYHCQIPFKGTFIYGWIAGEFLAPVTTPEQPVFMYTTTRLNLRSAMLIDPANVITVMPANTRVRVLPGSQGVPGGIPWVSVTTDSGQVGYCSKAYLSPNFTPPLPKPVGNGVKIGLHFLAGPNTGQFLEAVSQLAAAGKPLPSCTIVNDAGTAIAVKQRSPKTFVVYRLEVGNPSDLTYNRGLSRIGLISSCPMEMDAYQFDNELPNSPDYHRGLMDGANQAGIKVCVGNWAVGTSPMQFDPATLAMLAQCARDKHYCAYHAYSSQKEPQGNQDMTFESEWYAMRWLPMAQQFPALQFIFNEAGNFTANYLGSPQTLHLASQLNDMLKGYPNVKGANYWTFGGSYSGWSRSSIDPALPAFVQWMLSV